MPFEADFSSSEFLRIKKLLVKKANVLMNSLFIPPKLCSNVYNRHLAIGHGRIYSNNLANKWNDGSSLYWLD